MHIPIQDHANIPIEYTSNITIKRNLRIGSSLLHLCCAGTYQGLLILLSPDYEQTHASQAVTLDAGQPAASRSKYHN